MAGGWQGHSGARSSPRGEGYCWRDSSQVSAGGWRPREGVGLQRRRVPAEILGHLLNQGTPGQAGLGWGGGLSAAAVRTGLRSPQTSDIQGTSPGEQDPLEVRGPQLLARPGGGGGADSGAKQTADPQLAGRVPAGEGCFLKLSRFPEAPRSAHKGGFRPQAGPQLFGEGPRGPGCPAATLQPPVFLLLPIPCQRLHWPLPTQEAPPPLDL